MRRNRILASTFLALTLAAAAAPAAQRRYQAQYQRSGTLNREQYFRMLDRNRDGYLSPREYDGDTPFAYIDRNRDGYLSWYEWRDTRLGVTRGYQYNQYNSDRYNRYDRGQYNINSARLREFMQIDQNNDEFLSDWEWRGDWRTFARLDRDNDGTIHISEYLRQ